MVERAVRELVSRPYIEEVHPAGRVPLPGDVAPQIIAPGKEGLKGDAVHVPVLVEGQDRLQPGDLAVRAIHIEIGLLAVDQAVVDPAVGQHLVVHHGGDGRTAAGLDDAVDGKALVQQAGQALLHITGAHLGRAGQGTCFGGQQIEVLCLPVQP